jgi:hypothetical protein
MYIQQQLGMQIIFPGANPTDGFLSVQGALDDVASFLNQKVQVCLSTTQTSQQMQLKIDIFYMPSQSSTATTASASSASASASAHRMLSHKKHHEETSSSGTFQFTSA